MSGTRELIRSEHGVSLEKVTTRGSQGPVVAYYVRGTLTKAKDAADLAEAEMIYDAEVARRRAAASS